MRGMLCVGIHMQWHACTVSMYILESILRGKEGVRVQERQRNKVRAEGETHTRTHELRCVTEGVKINAVQAKRFHC